MKVMLDLCSGFGGASQAFEESDGWRVVRFEKDRAVIEHPITPFTIEADIMKSVKLDMMTCDIDLLWASPPCYDFTLAFNGPRAIHSRAGGNEPYEPSTALVERIVEIIRRKAPTYWVIENVKGSIKFLQPILGPPRMIKGPWVLWGNFPLFDFEFDNNHKARAGDKARHSKLRANHRAKIPKALSEGLLEAITFQKALGDFECL